MAITPVYFNLIRFFNYLKTSHFSSLYTYANQTFYLIIGNVRIHYVQSVLNQN